VQLFYFSFIAVVRSALVTFSGLWHDQLLIYLYDVKVNQLVRLLLRTQKMAQQGATLQSYNNELVKCSSFMLTVLFYKMTLHCNIALYTCKWKLSGSMLW